MTAASAANASPRSSEKKAASASTAASAQRASGPHFPHLPHPPVPHVQVAMPTGVPGRVLWWGGLAAVAAFGVVDWPVAVLVGAGSWVAEQYAKAARQPDGKQEKAA